MEYKLQDLDLDLFMMGRPWLSLDGFNVGYSDVTEVLDNQIEKELNFISKYSITGTNKKFITL